MSWKSIKQAAVALSTVEAEHMALSEAAREIAWLRKIMGQMGCPQKLPALVNEDNQGCIAWATGDGSTRRAKHIEAKHHCSKDTHEKGEVSLRHCPSETMLADALTKPLGGNEFQVLRAAIGVMEHAI
eukprot:Plantae.Rhodophyta-Hildenbrandia_rubra.ctg4015.p1 GENE.Plantae.Rhodophyta-Hildenbrandia_rubra.ctg4015~~Plantae.Rhodophyta-Hildenbrandia_rubra.ctg4015.p1  ORF type:complete len:128 (+),score=24.32 Plantae.Rhodophyta-Hildenbrandia_rubra.ctg4015:733-1116(+)